MSFQTHLRFGSVVVCDVCHRVGAICDRDWREMAAGADGEPLHLCRVCRKHAVWCAAHQSFHRPADNHRRACIVCGGLFTAQVQLHIEHCPSCRRAMPAQQPEQPPLSSYKRIIAKLLANPNGLKF